MSICSARRADPAPGPLPDRADSQLKYHFKTDQGVECLTQEEADEKAGTDPVYAPNSYGGPAADPSRTDDAGLFYADGEMVRAGYVTHAEDDDWGQAGTMVREVFDDEARERLVNKVAGHLLLDVSDGVLERAFEYWKNIDQAVGERIEQAVRQPALNRR